MPRPAHASLAAVLIVLTASAPLRPPAPGWLFPPEQSTAPRPIIPHTLPGSTLHPTDDQLGDLASAVDWYPGDHPHAPDPVLHGRAEAGACGFCHLVNGGGRPENASIAGLDADYIRRAVHGYTSGTRDSADPEFLAFRLMRATARAVDDAQIDAAAAYFSALPRHTFGKVVETALIPSPVGDAMVWRPDPSGKRARLGLRLIEMPDDFGRFKARDPHLDYTAYVPLGSIARGAQLARGLVPQGPPACAACHGADYDGTAIAPPLAGRSPTYIARQLVNYRSGARHGAEAQPMLAVAAPLGDRDIIALAAFMGSRPVGPPPHR
jgi:cytochrome c553